MSQSPPHKRQRSDSNSGPRPVISRLPGQHPKLPELETFAKDLQDSLSLIVRNNKSTYANVFVITMDFANTDGHVEPARGELVKTLENDYRFNMIPFQINNETMTGTALSSDTNLRLLGEVHPRLSRDVRKKHLFVVYYSGHGSLAGFPGRKHLNIHGRANDQANCYIPWDGIVRGCLRSDDSNDFLAILDCCNAGMAGMEHDIEVIAASAWETTAAGHIQKNFTTELNNVLKAAAISGPIPATHIVHNMLKAARSKSLPMPIHRLSFDPSKPSIVLAPLRPRSTLPTITPVKPGKYARVVISLTVDTQDKVPDLELFKRWLLNMVPPEIGKAEVLISFESWSTTYLVAIPFVMWCVIADREEYRFMAYQWADEGSIGASGAIGGPSVPAGILRERPQNIGESSNSKENRR